MTSPLISVTVPVHNTADYLPKCLDSLLDQTYPHLEIVCVDDGSADNSLKILQGYAARDPRIKVFQHTYSRGVSAARNTALRHSHGDFVTSVDSDDYIKPDLYEKAVTHITPETDLVCFGMQLVNSQGIELPDYDGYFALGYNGIQSFSVEMTDNINVCICSKLWRKSIIDQHEMQFPEGLVHEDDALFYMFTPFVRKAVFLPEPGYYYVQRPGSIMHDDRKSLADAVQYIGVIRYVFDFHQRCGLKPLNNAFLLRQFGRAYHLVERFCPEQHRRELADMFLKLGEETGLAIAHPDDWRIRSVKHLPRWLAPFIRCRSRCTQYRLGPIPLFSCQYDAHGTATLHFDLLHNTTARLKRLFTS